MLYISRSLGVDAAEGVAGVSGIGLHGVDVAVEALIGSEVVDHVQVLALEEVHFLERAQAFAQGLRILSVVEVHLLQDAFGLLT